MARTKTTASDSSANLGFKAKLWLSDEKLRNNMDAAEYSRAERDRLPKAARRASAEASVNHIVLGLIFLKYIAHTFDQHGGALGDISIYGQDKWARRQRPFGLATRARRVRLRRQQPKQSNPTTRRLAIMHLALRDLAIAFQSPTRFPNTA